MSNKVLASITSLQELLQRPESNVITWYCEAEQGKYDRLCQEIKDYVKPIAAYAESTGLSSEPLQELARKGLHPGRWGFDGGPLGGSTVFGPGLNRLGNVLDEVSILLGRLHARLSAQGYDFGSVLGPSGTEEHDSHNANKATKHLPASGETEFRPTPIAVDRLQSLRRALREFIDEQYSTHPVEEFQPVYEAMKAFQKIVPTVETIALTGHWQRLLSLVEDLGYANQDGQILSAAEPVLMEAENLCQRWKGPQTIKDNGNGIGRIATPTPPAADQNEGICEKSARKLRPCCEKAYRQYQGAQENVTNLQTDRDAYDWLKDEDTDTDDEDLPAFASWSKYLRDARKHYAANKNTPRKSKQSNGKSVVRKNQI